MRCARAAPTCANVRLPSAARLWSVSSATRNHPMLRISESVRGDGRDLYKRALAEGWEGLIAKHADSLYRSGKRSPDWRKVKIVHEQEFVIGGWTEPRQTRAYFGALLLGVYEEASGLVYVGHIGTGFNERELGAVDEAPETARDRRLPVREPAEDERAPALGEAGPGRADQVHRVDGRRPSCAIRCISACGTTRKREDVRREPEISRARSSPSRKSDRNAPNGTRVASGPGAAESRNVRRRTVQPSGPGGPTPDAIAKMLDQLRALETSRRDGSLELPDGDRLSVTNLHKVFWPKQKLTKGDLLRYYAQVAPFILPAVAGSPAGDEAASQRHHSESRSISIERRTKCRRTSAWNLSPARRPSPRGSSAGA